MSGWKKYDHHAHALIVDQDGKQLISTCHDQRVDLYQVHVRHVVQHTDVVYILAQDSEEAKAQACAVSLNHLDLDEAFSSSVECVERVPLGIRGFGGDVY